MSKNDELLTDAIRDTETEIANSVFDKEDGDDDADRSLEAMDDEEGEGDEEVEADADGEVEAKDGDGKADAKVEPERDANGKFVKPDGRTAALREERGKRQTVEQERDQYKTNFDAITARLENLNGQITALTRTAPRQQEQPKAIERPDPIVDPDGYARSVRDEVEAGIISRNVEETFRDAHEEHGNKFEAAYQALTSLDRNSPSDRALVQRISKSANPGRALMRWHTQQEAVREIGDPSKYRERVRNELLEDPEFEKAVVARVRERANGGNQQRRPTNNITRLPSLNSSGSGSGRQSRSASDDDDSDAAVAAYAFRD